jgi:hypothetical protein
MVFFLTAGQRHEVVAFEPLMEQGAVKRVGPGRPRKRPYRIIGDKGYNNGQIRRYLQRRGIQATIPFRKGQHRGRRFDQGAYRARNRIERLILTSSSSFVE